MTSPVNKKFHIEEPERKSGWSSSDEEDTKPVLGKRFFEGSALVRRPDDRPLRQKMAPRKENNSYNQAANQIGNTQWKSSSLGDILLFKQLTLGDQTFEVDTKILGKGDSFQCYKVTDQPKVIKIFVHIQDGATLKGRGAPTTKELDDRMESLAGNYYRGIALGIPCAEILNIRTLKEDGCIVQVLVAPLKLTWVNPAAPLANNEKVMLNQFCDCLEKAILDADSNAWDLAPKNFGFDGENGLQLFDISDRTLSTDQWTEFQSAIKKWINGHPGAKQLIIDRLQALPEKPELTDLINRLRE